MVGPGDAGQPACAAAEEAGRLIAQRGAVLVCGGLGGVMAAAARGASASGGVSVGIIPGGDRSRACPGLTVVVASGLGEIRNALVVGASDAVVAVGGSWGTLSEVALAVRTARPVAALRSWTVADGEGQVEGIAAVGSPAEAVEHVFAALGRD